MKRYMKLITTIIAVSIFTLVLPKTNTYAEQSVPTAVYFTGIGCPHCSKVSPELHKEIENGNLILIEYELYQENSNAKIMYEYSERYNISLSIPNILYKEDLSRVGDTEIKNNLPQDLNSASRKIAFADQYVNWEEAYLDDLPGLPKIYSQDKAAVSITSSEKPSEECNQMLKDFILKDIEEVIEVLHGQPITNEETRTINYPGGSVTYEHGVETDGWRLLWNGPELINADVKCEDVDFTEEHDPNCEQDISLFKVISLALTDSINPCALSVLTMMLIAIVTYHPKKPKQILFSGLAFVLAVFVTYIIYGLLIVKAFQLLQSISTIKMYLYNGLGVIATILGLLEIKDFFFYKPGSIGTEMPLFLRPKVQKIIAKITSPAGAFGLGMFVTLFLLPCTVGPYIILGGILSVSSLLGSLPYLLLYNAVFVLPMVVVVVLIFFSTERIDDIENWRKDNIKTIHLVIGIIFIILGITMITGIL